MTILITGGKGQLGSEFDGLSDVKKVGHDELDICDTHAMEQAFEQFKPEIVVNCAAYTAVDRAEEERGKAFAVNEQGPSVLAEHCKAHNIPMIHISTDYVFDGGANRPYQETDVAAPLNVYGASKLAGEKAVLSKCSQSIVLRVSGVFGQHGHNFVKTMLRLAKEHSTLHIVNDQTLCPTPAADIAAAVMRIIDIIREGFEDWGIYHFSSSRPVTWHGFACSIFELSKRIADVSVDEVVPITTEEYPLPAKRPAYSVLDCHKLVKRFDIDLKDWEPGLIKVLGHNSL